MFALNETAVLYPRSGRRGGTPAYARPGVEFRLRSELVRADAACGDSVERGANLRIFAVGVNAQPGDRVELEGRSYRIVEVRRVRGLAGIHHLEMLARAEARGGAE